MNGVLYAKEVQGRG